MPARIRKASGNARRKRQRNRAPIPVRKTGVSIVLIQISNQTNPMANTTAYPALFRPWHADNTQPAQLRYAHSQTQKTTMGDILRADVYAEAAPKSIKLADG